MGKRKRRIVLVGPVPPPYGGISVQIMELSRLLPSRGYPCSVLDVGYKKNGNLSGLRKVSKFLQFLGPVVESSMKGNVVHFMTNGHNLKSWILSMVCGLAGLLGGKRFVLTVGSGLAPAYIGNTGILDRTIIRLTLSTAGCIIVRNAASKEVLVSMGATRDKIEVLSGFLGLAHLAARKIPDPIAGFANSHKPLLGAYAGVEPEYGTPLLLAGVGELRKIFPKLGVVILGVPQESEKRLALVDNLAEHVYWTGFLPHDIAVGVMKRFDVFVRTSYYDGDSNIVREALALGIPVVASRTHFRPRETILFEIGDREGMVHKTAFALQHIDELKLALSRCSHEQNGNLDRLLRLYDKALG